jgi:hypothetical protein
MDGPVGYVSTSRLVPETKHPILQKERFPTSQLGAQPNGYDCEKVSSRKTVSVAEKMMEFVLDQNSTNLVSQIFDGLAAVDWLILRFLL